MLPIAVVQNYTRFHENSLTTLRIVACLGLIDRQTNKRTDEGDYVTFLAGVKIVITLEPEHGVYMLTYPSHVANDSYAIYYLTNSELLPCK